MWEVTVVVVFMVVVVVMRLGAISPFFLPLSPRFSPSSIASSGSKSMFSLSLSLLYVDNIIPNIQQKQSRKKYYKLPTHFFSQQLIIQVPPPLLVPSVPLR